MLIDGSFEKFVIRLCSHVVIHGIVNESDMNRERLSAVLVDRENVVTQKNLEIAFFGEFRVIIRAIAPRTGYFLGRVKENMPC